MPLIVPQPGFLSKTWLTGRDSGDFMGYYEFETVANAEAYRSSLPIRLMSRRAAAGSMTFRVFEPAAPETEREE
jgi:hypothetical protein